jgi:hypothetical protein
MMNKFNLCIKEIKDIENKYKNAYAKLYDYNDTYHNLSIYEKNAIYVKYIKEHNIDDKLIFKKIICNYIFYNDCLSECIHDVIIKKDTLNIIDKSKYNDLFDDVNDFNFLFIDDETFYILTIQEQYEIYNKYVTIENNDKILLLFKYIKLLNHYINASEKKTDLEYNNLINEYNVLINKYNVLNEKYNDGIEKYNDSGKKYNNLLKMYNNLITTSDKKYDDHKKESDEKYDELRKKYNELNYNRYDENYVSNNIYSEYKTECGQS